jgi:hypothetical protein
MMANRNDRNFGNGKTLNAFTTRKGSLIPSGSTTRRSNHGLTIK